MASLKEMLVKPYIDIEFDEGDVVRVPAAWSDCRRFVEQWPELSKRIEAQYDQTDPKTLLEGERELFRLMCGDGKGDLLMRKCLDYLTDGTGLSDEQVALNVTEVLSYVAGLWLKQVKAMGAKHDQHVRSYLRDADEDAGDVL